MTVSTQESIIRYKGNDDTTAWVSNKFKVVSTLPTTQQNGVFYFVTGG